MIFLCQNIFQYFAQYYYIIIISFGWQTILSSSETLCHKQRAEHYLILIWNYYHYLWLLCVGNPIKMNRNTFITRMNINMNMNWKCSMFIHECVWLFRLVALHFNMPILFTLHLSRNAWIQFDPIHIHISTPLKMITHHNHHNNFSPMTIYTYSTLPTPSPMLNASCLFFHITNVFMMKIDARAQFAMNFKLENAQYKFCICATNDMDIIIGESRGKNPVWINGLSIFNAFNVHKYCLHFKSHFSQSAEKS